MVKRVWLLCCFVLCSYYLSAMPIDPTPIIVNQPNGTSITIRHIGDEFLHYTTTLDGYLIKKDEAGIYLSLSGLLKGVYYLRLIINNNMVESKQIIVN